MYDLQHNRYKLIQDAVAHACQSVGGDYTSAETSDLLNHVIPFMWAEIQAHVEELNGMVFGETIDEIQQDRLEEIASTAYTIMVSTDDLRDILEIKNMVRNEEAKEKRMFKILRDVFTAHALNDFFTQEPKRSNPLFQTTQKD